MGSLGGGFVSEGGVARGEPIIIRTDTHTSTGGVVPFLTTQIAPNEMVQMRVRRCCARTFPIGLQDGESAKDILYADTQYIMVGRAGSDTPDVTMLDGSAVETLFTTTSPGGQSPAGSLNVTANAASVSLGMFDTGQSNVSWDVVIEISILRCVRGVSPF